MLDEAERQWAPCTDPIFELVPQECDKHLSSVYAKLGSPGVNFYSFWDVYNQLCDAADSDFLERTTNTSEDEDTVTVEELLENEGVVEQLPLTDLRPCVFGENGVPARRTYEGE